jgi:hypothetical protein
MRSRPSTGGVEPARRQLCPRWLALALLLGLSCGTSGETEEPVDLRAAAVTGRVRVFLIAPQDGGALGRRIGCGDSAVPVAVDLPQPAPALEGALRALLAMDARYDRASGLYNALFASPLEIRKIERAGAEARVYLSGYLEIGDRCDGERVLAQLTETALQFQDVQRVQIWLEDRPLRELLAPSSRAGGGR